MDGFVCKTFIYFEQFCGLDTAVCKDLRLVGFKRTLPKLVYNYFKYDFSSRIKKNMTSREIAFLESVEFFIKGNHFIMFINFLTY